MLKELKKTIKVELILLKLNLQTLFAYRVNALLIFLGSGLYNFGAILFITFLFSKIPLLTGWDKWDLIFLYGIGQVFGYIFLFLTYPNNHHFLDIIDNGFFDFFITKPINSLIYSTLNIFAFEHLAGLIQAMAIIIYALSNKAYEISFIGIPIAMISLLIALTITHLLNVITLIPTFWTVKNQFFRFFSDTSNVSNYPYEIFDNKIIRFFFFTIIPYGLLINVPFRAIIGKLDIRLFLLQIVVCIGFIIVTGKLWKWGVRNYSSASS